MIKKSQVFTNLFILEVFQLKTTKLRTFFLIFDYLGIFYTCLKKLEQGLRILIKIHTLLPKQFLQHVIKMNVWLLKKL